jgi:hypothetical protein
MSSGLRCGTILGLKTLLTFTQEGVQCDKLRHVYYSLCGHTDLSCGVWKSMNEVTWFYVVNAKNDRTPFLVQTPLTLTSQRSQWSLNYTTYRHFSAFPFVPVRSGYQDNERKSWKRQLKTKGN